MINMNEYKILTIRSGDGNYSTVVTYNGERVVSEVSEPLKSLIDGECLTSLRSLADHRGVSEIEVAFRGEDLK